MPTLAACDAVGHANFHYCKDADELTERLALCCSSIQAGNESLALKNEVEEIRPCWGMGPLARPNTWRSGAGSWIRNACSRPPFSDLGIPPLEKTEDGIKQDSILL